MAQHVTIAQRRAALAEPHDCTDAADELTIQHALFDTLVKRVRQGFVPHLATGWTVGADARSWTFHLRPGQVFHDGTPCDAMAVVASLARMARPDKGYALGAPAVWRQYLGGAKLSAPDPLTVVVELPEPLADLLDILEQGFILSPDSTAALDRGEDVAPVGSGPYRLTSRAPDRITAARVAGHFAAGGPAQVTWCAVPDPAERLALLLQGEVEVATLLDPATATALTAAGHTRHDYLSPVAIIYLLNAARGPLADARLRQALSLGVDRAALIDTVLDGMAQPLRGFVSPVHFGAGDASRDPFDPDRARAMIAEAGYAQGLRLSVDCPTRLPDEAERLTAALAEQLARLGIALDVTRHTDREGYAHMVRRKEIGDMCVFDSSPMSTFRVLFEKIDARVAGSWWQGYHNAQAEALLDQGRRETDSATRAAIYAEAYGVLQDDPPWLTLYNPQRVMGLAGGQPDFAMPVDGVIDVTALPYP
ncbi:ABC transporter substrate-binding protein [Roseicyclus mahoneyensis]|uniref:Peptide/nickel transport system substrate-binding protein n=1 Tax=Roseicyclus mahoneyensis TaxID=164332 RepID=A0A316GAY0_9RHOB|nr:ABC transporter substrate-binding protein [Roseicyclus mahoneyensis]PWK58129.1 peptide/nickel transport system substrate-binding protein [Roseicyclus mahoneyensis]